MKSHRIEFLYTEKIGVRLGNKLFYAINEIPDGWHQKCHLILCDFSLWQPFVNKSRMCCKAQRAMFDITSCTL